MKSQRSTPLVSVVMPVYNPGSFLIGSIESILSQTFSDFEFIIIDDASTDGSWSIIKSYARKDKRIRAFRNAINLGVSLTSNIALSKAKGKYIARMDSDDISTLDRLEKQVKYLKKHTDTIVVGGQCTIIDQENRIVGYKNFPSSQKDIKDMIFWAVPIQQGYMMVNRSLLPKNFTWYSPSKYSAEEVDLYFNLFKFGNFFNLKDNLYYYRQLPGSLSHLNPKKTFWLTLQSRLNAINSGFQPTYKSLLINLIQILVIMLVPASAVSTLWYLIRGISSFGSAKIGTPIQVKV